MAESKPYVISSLIGGISEQSPQSRPQACNEYQQNCINDPLNDVIARPGGHVQSVIQYTMDDPFEHTIRRGATEQYKVLIENGQMKIINLIGGTLCTAKRFALKGVRMDQYLKHTGPARLAFAAVTVEDTTFIVNRQKTVKFTKDKVADRPNRGLFYFRSASYSTTYVATLIVNGVSYQTTYTTPDNSDPGNAVYIQTNLLAKEFRDSIQSLIAANSPALDGFTATLIGGFELIDPTPGSPSSGDEYRVSRRGSSVIITGPAGTTFDLDSSDGEGDTQLVAFTDTIKKFSDLPLRAPNGYIVKVQGSQADQTDDYWLKFDGKGTQSGWVEVPKPGIPYKLDAGTMPFLLKNVARNAFSCARGKWGDRLVGDGVKTAKRPMMVNHRIRDLNFISGRLCVVGEGYNQMSRSRNAYNFFPDTAQARLDTDPIGVEIATGGVTVIRQSVAVAGKLFLWGDGTQIRVDSGDSALSEETIDHIPSTNYEFDGGFRPVPIGAGSVVFGTTVGNSCKLKEVMYRNGSALGEIPLNDHCPKLIQGHLRQIAVGHSSGFLAVLNSTGGDKIFVYQWLNQGDQRVQTAWNKWTFSGVDRVVSCAVLQGCVYMLFQVGNKLVTEKITLDPTDLSERYIRLDHRVAHTGAVYSGPGSKKATLTLPYAIPTDLRGDYVVIENAAGEDEEGRWRGRPLKFKFTSGSTIEVTLNESNGKFWFGSRVSAQLELTQLYVQDPRGGTLLPEQNTIQKIQVSSTETSEFRVLVEDLDNGDTIWDHRYDGRKNISRVLNRELPLQTEENTFAVDRKADKVKITLINDTVYPSRWSQLVYWYAETRR